MVYKKRVYRKRRANGAMSVAKKALKLATKNKPERKATQAFGNVLATDWGGDVIPFFDPTPGVGVSQRIGDEVYLDHIKLHAVLDGQAASSLYRLMIVNDKCAEITAAASVLDATGNAQAPLSFVDYTNRKKFNILFDKMYYTKNATSKDDYIINKVIKYKKKVRWDAASGDIVQNKPFILMINDQATDANAPDLSFKIECVYTDA